MTKATHDADAQARAERAWDEFKAIGDAELRERMSWLAGYDPALFAAVMEATQRRGKRGRVRVRG